MRLLPIIAQEITSKILAELERGVLPWKKPWDGAPTGAVVLPRRHNGENYRGVNVITLWSASVAHGYVSPYWLTVKQTNQLGAFIRKGERGEIVVYYGHALKTRTDDHGKASQESFRFLNTLSPSMPIRLTACPIAFVPPLCRLRSCQSRCTKPGLRGLDIKRVLTRDTACYAPRKDVIGMLPVGAFDSAEVYGATLDHEAVHAAMTPHRVGRDMGKRFSQHALAAEELVAEIGASILGAHLGLPPHHICDHASYIGHWMKKWRARHFFINHQQKIM